MFILAKQKSCFLRPDTGPCRADIIQYYFDVKQKRCYRFFWGGCQGNGNRFDTKEECYSKCRLNYSNPACKFYLSICYYTKPHHLKTNDCCVTSNSPYRYYSAFLKSKIYIYTIYSNITRLKSLFVFLNALISGTAESN